jgi:rare lipoprotein A
MRVFQAMLAHGIRGFLDTLRRGGRHEPQYSEPVSPPASHRKKFSEFRIPSSEFWRVTFRGSSVVAISVLLILGVATGCAHRKPPPTVPEITVREPEPAEPGKVEKGIASWYGKPFHGRRTASGEVYDMHQISAAHRTLAFGTVVRVTRRDTKASVEVRINDRGPFIKGRIIDLSFAAAKRIGLDIDGVAPVKVEVLDRRRRVKPEPPSAEPADPKHCWWVQIGAFGDEGNARRAEAELKAAGEPTVVMEAPGGLRRVRVGPFDSKKKAGKTRKRLRNAWPDAQLVECGR